MVDEILKTKFNKGAKSYDRQRTIVIPNLDQLYNIITDLADSNIPVPRILDLGAGTGLLTENIFNKYPRGYFTLIDISEEMLDIARKRFKDNLNFKYILGDYLKADFGDSFDIIVSSLSIHHLEDNDKRIIYSKVYELLNDEGIFLNADQVLAPSSENEYIYQKNWLEKIETGTLNQDEKDVIIDRMKHDKPAT
ncbi:MAG TPA: class I SAM-dependent methyltransferase, partial [Methanobacterium sp.]